MPTYERPVNVE